MEGHASWVEAYYPAGTKLPTSVGGAHAVPLYEWMLSHRRSEAASVVEGAAHGKGRQPGAAGEL